MWCRGCCLQGCILLVINRHCRAISETQLVQSFCISELADICHSHDIPLLVDEAHGGHFHFGAEFPPDALSCGADLVMHSTHKSLTAMTQVRT